MKIVKKKEGKIQKAYCLGEKHPELDKLLLKGSIKKEGEKHWRIFSREAESGELASEGDYIKLDSKGTPYPNDREFFWKNHKHLQGDEYEQLPQPLKAWDIEEGMCQEIRFLMEHKGLEIHSDDEEQYFRAPLWGDLLSAAKDAVLVFYEVAYDENGTVADADFNFVARDEFVVTYDVLGTI